MRRLALAACLAALAARPAPAAEGPRVVVEEMTSRALEVLGDRSLAPEEKRRRVEQIAERHGDFETMSRLVLARNWARFSPAEQAEFVKEFKQHLSVTYGRRIESYQNERVEITGDREEARGDWTVRTKILRGGGAPDILVDYRLRRQNEAWRVIDIVIERVSLVANFRSQFQDLMSRGGPARILEVLRERNARGEPLPAP